MTKVNQSNENETKTDIFPWDMFQSDLLASSNSITKVRKTSEEK